METLVPARGEDVLGGVHGSVLAWLLSGLLAGGAMEAMELGLWSQAPTRAVGCHVSGLRKLNAGNTVAVVGEKALALWLAWRWQDRKGVQGACWCVAYLPKARLTHSCSRMSMLRPWYWDGGHAAAGLGVGERGGAVSAGGSVAEALTAVEGRWADEVKWDVTGAARVGEVHTVWAGALRVVAAAAGTTAAGPVGAAVPERARPEVMLPSSILNSVDARFAASTSLLCHSTNVLPPAVSKTETAGAAVYTNYQL